VVEAVKKYKWLALPVDLVVHADAVDFGKFAFGHFVWSDNLRLCGKITAKNDTYACDCHE
jgi:hypothetical protein